MRQPIDDAEPPGQPPEPPLVRTPGRNAGHEARVAVFCVCLGVVLALSAIVAAAMQGGGS